MASESEEPRCWTEAPEREMCPSTWMGAKCLLMAGHTTVHSGGDGCIWSESLCGVPSPSTVERERCPECNAELSAADAETARRKFAFRVTNSYGWAKPITAKCASCGRQGTRSPSTDGGGRLRCGCPSNGEAHAPWCTARLCGLAIADGWRDGGGR